MSSFFFSCSCTVISDKSFIYFYHSNFIFSTFYFGVLILNVITAYVSFTNLVGSNDYVGSNGFWEITVSTAFDVNIQDTADSMQNLFSTKQFIASAYLFQELFAMIRSLSYILQVENIVFGKTLSLLDSALEQLLKLRSDPPKIIHVVEEILMESSGKKRELQEGYRCQVSLPKMNLQPLQKKSDDVKYSMQLFTPLLPE